MGSRHKGVGLYKLKGSTFKIYPEYKPDVAEKRYVLRTRYTLRGTRDLYHIASNEVRYIATEYARLYRFCRRQKYRNYFEVIDENI